MTDTSPEAVERFDINWRDYRKDIDANGDYVTYEDYAALSKQLTAAKTTLDTFKASHQINLALRKAAEEHITTAHAAGKAEGLRAAAKRYRDGGTIENCELDAALAFIPADTPAAKVTVEGAVRDALYDALGEALDCTRVWEAWSYGTMTEDDFSPVRDDEARMEELTQAALRAITGGKP
jgi:hypothetical protein